MYSILMVSIAPSLLSADFAAFGECVRKFEAAKHEARPDMIHFDIMDGHFVPNLTFGASLVKALRGLTEIPFDVHLMVANPADHIAPCLAAGADRIAVHIESVSHAPRVLDSIRAGGAAVGIALNPATPLESLQWLEQHIDFALVMGVNPGFGGQALLASTIEKLRACKSHSKLGSIALAVDGGVAEENARELTDAGAQVLIAGSSLFAHEDPTEAVRALRQAAT